MVNLRQNLSFVSQVVALSSVNFELGVPFGTGVVDGFQHLVEGKTFSGVKVQRFWGLLIPIQFEHCGVVGSSNFFEVDGHRRRLLSIGLIA